MALAVAILPQQLVPPGARVVPVAIVPVVRLAVFVLMVAVVARRVSFAARAAP